MAAGGFSFWPLLPHEHAGEDRVAQWCVMEQYGGAGILPSAAVHLEAPATVTDRRVEASDIVFAFEPGALPDRTYDAPTAVSHELSDS